MRHAMSNKLRSQRGASLLLALLFLLICSMVAASILMAAAANAGKSRSNLSEHQTYLALSSAVSLLCDELNGAEYNGQYTCWTTTEDGGEDADGNPITYTYYHFKQEVGAYSGRLAPMLVKNFDALFARSINGASALTGYATKGTQPTDVPATHTLVLTPDTGSELLDGQEITVVMEVQSSYAIYLTATLGDYTIKAELTPIQTELVLPPALEVKGPSQIQSVGPMQWEIGWITTGEEEGEP